VADLKKKNAYMLSFASNVGKTLQLVLVFICDEFVCVGGYAVTSMCY